MASKKNKTATTSTTNLPALRIGSRVRCTDDGVTGRIVWANAVAVKVKWDDGEQVTWKRDSLAGQPLEILDTDGADDQTPAPADTDAAAAIAAAPEAEQPAAPSDTAVGELTATSEQVQEAPAAAELVITEPKPTSLESAAEPIAAEPVAPEPVTLPAEPAAEPTAPVGANDTTQPSAKAKRQRKTPAAPPEKKVSALNAAAKVLAEEGRPMTCKELIAAMAAKGYWTSPDGQTPDATLYSAIAREITLKGVNSRFQKTARGQFARTPAV